MSCFKSFNSLVTKRGRHNSYLMVYRGYRRKRYRKDKHKRKRKLRGQDMFIDTLKNLCTAWYCAWGGK